MTARLTRQGVRDLNGLGPRRPRTPPREIPIPRPMPGPYDDYLHHLWRGTCVRIGCPCCGGPAS